jgi:ferrous iron transport protein A
VNYLHIGLGTLKIERMHNMTLKDAKIGASYTVNSLNLDIVTRRRLEALGLTKGTDINVLNRSRSGAVILMVRGSRLAIGSKIAETIHMKEAS